MKFRDSLTDEGEFIPKLKRKKLHKKPAVSENIPNFLKNGNEGKFENVYNKLMASIENMKKEVKYLKDNRNNQNQNPFLVLMNQNKQNNLDEKLNKNETLFKEKKEYTLTLDVVSPQNDNFFSIDDSIFNPLFEKQPPQPQNQNTQKLYNEALKPPENPIDETLKIQKNETILITPLIKIKNIPKESPKKLEQQSNVFSLIITPSRNKNPEKIQNLENDSSIKKFERSVSRKLSKRRDELKLRKKKRR